MPSNQHPYVLGGLALAVLLVLAYSVLIAQQLLLGVMAAVWLPVLYLLWRFIRAHERIAAALEARNEAR